MLPNPELNPLASSHDLILEMFDDAVPDDLFRQACTSCEGRGWYFGNGTQMGDGSRFWKMDLDGNAVFTAIWEQVRPRCEALAGGPLRVIRQYANGHTYGLGGKPHPDDERPGTFTLLYYPMPEWQDAWEGETIYFESSGEIMFAVKPRPNRMVFFDSRISHAGRAPSRSCTALRVSVAYKLEIVNESAAGPSKSAEEGVTRAKRIRIPSARVDAAIAERLEKLAKTVRLPGFRPGQIPAEILRQRYGREARREVVERLSSETVGRLMPEGICPSSVVLVTGEESGDLEIAITGTHMASLPDIDFSKVPIERLTLSEAAAQAAQLKPETAVELLRSDLKNQVLDRLDASYQIPVLPLLVERELIAIWKALEAAGQVPEDPRDKVRERDRLRPIAERRVRLGWVLAELARRGGITAQDGSELEEKVIDHILSLADVTGREASEQDLRDLAAE
jgi:SM-20-related protein